MPTYGVDGSEAATLDGHQVSDFNHSHVRLFKLQAQKIRCSFMSCSTWPLLGKAGDTIMKRRLIML